MKLFVCLHKFFDQYLPNIKGVSHNTIMAYRDAFKLFLPFAAQYHGIQIASLRLDHLTADLILAFLNNLEDDRGNITNTRNHRLAALKSFARMLRFVYPEKRQIAEVILRIPQKRALKQLIGFLYPDEVLKVFAAVKLTKSEGFRDYTLLHLLYDSGARATEIATLKLDYFNPGNRTLSILGKGNRYRMIEIWPKTAQLIERYIRKYRQQPKPLYQHYLFINQQKEAFRRHGIYRICRKYLTAALPEKRLKNINPVHSFRHSCAVRMLASGRSVAEIRNHLGHEDLQSTTLYLHLNISHKRKIQKQFIQYIHSSLKNDPKLDDLIGWENKEDTLAWLDSL